MNHQPSTIFVQTLSPKAGTFPMSRLTPRKCVEISLRGGRSDRVPFAMYETKIPQCTVERELRNRGMCIVKRDASGFKTHFPNVKITPQVYWEGEKQFTRTWYETPVGKVSTLVEAAGFTSWAHEFRYRPPTRRMIELARQGDAGTLGTTTMLTMHMGHAGGLKDVAADSWRMNPRNVSGGSGNLLGVHGIDLANALFGSPRRVTAGLQRNVSRLPFEDTTAFTIEYERAIAVITTSYVSQPLETACLMGRRGNLIARDGKLFLEPNRQSTEISDLPAECAMDCLLREFVAAVREHRPPETGGEVGMATVAVLEAALSSAQPHDAVELTEVLGLG
jgi:hypothetical protein